MSAWFEASMSALTHRDEHRGRALGKSNRSNICCRLPRWQTVCPASIFSGSARRRVSPKTTHFAAVEDVGSQWECPALAAHRARRTVVGISVLAPPEMLAPPQALAARPCG